MVKNKFQSLERLIDKNNVLIYQMGKVGSISLEQSISNSLNTHYFYNNPACPLFFNATQGGVIGRLRVEARLPLVRFLVKRRKEVKIICVTRELFGRNVSMFFQHLESWMFSAVTGYPDSKRYKLASRNIGLQIGFIHDVFDNNFNHEYALEWFDREFKRFTGIDVFQHPFNKEEGYGRIKNGVFDCLLLTVEQMGNNIGLIEEFVGQKINLDKANVGADKWYACVYREFKRTYRPSEEYLSQIYSSQVMRHFYSEDQIEAFKQSALSTD